MKVETSIEVKIELPNRNIYCDDKEREALFDEIFTKSVVYKNVTSKYHLEKKLMSYELPKIHLVLKMSEASYALYITSIEDLVNEFDRVQNEYATFKWFSAVSNDATARLEYSRKRG